MNNETKVEYFMSVDFGTGEYFNEELDGGGGFDEPSSLEQANVIGKEIIDFFNGSLREGELARSIDHVFKKTTVITIEKL